MEHTKKQAIIEAMLFANGKEVSSKNLMSALEINAEELKKIIDLLKQKYESENLDSDTDSIKVTSHGNEILQNSPEFFVDPLKLGAWGYEGRYETARFVRQKTYSYEQVDKHGELQRHYTVCGAPDSVKLAMKIDDFKPGMIITLEQLHREGREGRLLPVRVPGGVILEETGFQINTVENWDEASGLNMPINYELFCDIIKKKNEEGKGLENG